MVIRTITFLIAASIALLGVAPAAGAEVLIGLPLWFPPRIMPIGEQVFAAKDQRDQDLARRLTDIIAADLASSSRYAPTIEDQAPGQADLPHWRTRGAEVLLEGAILRGLHGQQIRFRIWDVF